MRGFFDEIRSMSGRYASYWNAFLLDCETSLSSSGVMPSKYKVAQNHLKYYRMS